MNESLESLRPMGLTARKNFYFDRGTSEWRNFLPFVERLKDVGLVYGQNVYYYEVNGADHEMRFWLLRIEVPFRLFVEGTADLVDMEVTGFCVEDLDSPGTEETRINPVVTYSNGIQFSVMTEAEFEVVDGSGSVQTDGTFTISSGNSMTVACSYMGLTKEVQVEGCD